MIYVDSVGRMGNHMFQLAFAHATARRLGTSYILGPSSLVDDFELGGWSRRSVRLARKLAFRARYGNPPHERVDVDIDDDPSAVLAALRDGVVYGGFFQSARYFAGYEDDVRKLFAVRPQPLQTFNARYGSLGRYVCIHLRRGDYSGLGWALPTGYFLDALATVEDLGDVPVIVISDDPDTARSELASVEGARFEVNDRMVDFQLLMNASVVIASNSTFAWWGAWLNRVEGARVIVPEHWLGPEGREWPRDVIADGWERCAVPLSGSRVFPRANL